MIKKLLLSLVVVAALTGCNKNKYNVEYAVKCGSCNISYYDENAAYVERIPATGTWSYSFEATQDNQISVAAQSQLCQDTVACNDSIQLYADSVYVTIKVDGKVNKTASQGNREFAAAWAEIFLD